MTVLVAAAVLGSSWQAIAQLPPRLGPGGQGGDPTPVEEPTTAPPPASDTTAPPETTTTAPPITLLPPSSEAPPSTDAPPTSEAPAPGGPPSGSTPDPVGEGDGGAPGVAGLVVPPEAQAVINSIARSAPFNNMALVDGAAQLEAAGVSRDEAIRAAYGRFPILGPSHWTDDWYFPRWTGTTFRYHQGLDMFAAYGTPVAAPVDGVARIGNNALGGLTVKVVEPDGTYWYLAHLAGLAEGLVDGQAVTTGQVVGFVGDSGNARGGAPHLHFGVYPGGGGAVPPKPIVDSWVAEGAQRVAEILGTVSAAPQPAGVVATDLTRRLADGTTAGPGLAPSGPPRSELLWASAANPAGGGLRLAEAAAAAINESVDWEQRAAEQRATDLAWARSADDAQRLLAPLVNPLLRQAAEAQRSGGGAALVQLTP